VTRRGGRGRSEPGAFSPDKTQRNLSTVPMPMQAPQRTFAKRLIVLVRSSVIFAKGGRVSVAQKEERRSKRRTGLSTWIS
jgi:hypothetical protein